LAFDFSFLAGLGSQLLQLEAMGGYFLIGLVLLIPLTVCFLLWVGIYASNCFLAVVEQTAAGNDRISWPEGGAIIDGLWRALYVAWLLVVSAVPVAMLWLVELGISRGSPWDLAWVAAPGVLLFSLALLSTLTANSPWVLLHGDIFLGLGRKPSAIVLAWLVPLVLATLAWVVSCTLYFRSQLLFALIAGLCGATFVLLYGRLLGRAGWLISQRPSGRRARRKRPPRAVVQAGGWGGEDDSSDDPPRA
jgi:hypothetical protein